MNIITQYIPLPLDQINLILGVLACFPLSLILKQIKNPFLNIVISTTIAFIFQYIILGNQCYFLWIQQLLIFFICKYGPRSNIGIIVALQSFAYLTLIHARRYILDLGLQVDITAIMMMQTWKFIGFAYSYEDGLKKNSQIDYISQLQRRIVKYPSFLYYIGYVQFLPAAIIGPIFEYSDYQNYLNRQKNYETIPGTLRPALEELSKFLLLCVIYIAISTYFNLDYIMGKEFEYLNPLYQFLYILIYGYALRFKYYTCWSMSMIGMKASGITYEKIKNQKGQIIDSFDRIQISRIITIETQLSFKNKIDNWNMSAQTFLRRYVYQKIYIEKNVEVKNKKKLQARAQILTISLSAFWHGLYPSYVICFFHLLLCLQIAQQLFRVGKSRPELKYMFNKSIILQTIIRITNEFYIGYCAVIFNIFKLNKIWSFLKISYGSYFVILYLVYYLIVIRRIGEKHLQQKKKD